MGRLIPRIVLLFACTLPFVVTDVARAEMTGREIMEKSRQANQSDTQVSEIEMLLIDKKDKKQNRAIKIWAVQSEGGESRTLTRFTKPNNVKGVGFLVHGEGAKAQRWLYLPRMKKTRMIAEGDKDKPFMGTDFTYYDLSPHDVEGSQYDPVTSDTKDGLECYVVSGRPNDVDASLYSRVVQWVRKDNYVPIAVDFYDKAGDLLKQSRVLDLEEINGNWTPMKMEMHNVQTNHRTVMTVTKVEYDVDIPGRYFEKAHLARGK